MTIVSSQKNVSMWYDRVTKPKEWKMEVLWGAWVKKVTREKEPPYSIDINGIYDTINKHVKGDFPFTINLKVILAFEAQASEQERIFKCTLRIIDLDARDIFAINDQIAIPNGDIPLRWYEDYEFNDVLFREPGYYELSILINDEQRQ